MHLSHHLTTAISTAGAKVRFRYPWWLRPFLFPNIVGITLGRRIYLSPRVTQQQVERFLRHELAHVRQIARLGLVRFYWQYLVEYVRLRRRGMSSSEAYRNISFEMEAAAAEETV